MSTDRPYCEVQVSITKITQNNEWMPFRWQLESVTVIGPNAEPIPDNDEFKCWSRAKVELYLDEVDGYYLNCTANHPAWFVHYRLDEEMGDEAIPEVRMVTLSYNEAGRTMDGGELVENVPTDKLTAGWLAEFTQKHFVSEPRKRRRPASFVAPGARTSDNVGKNDT